MYDDWLVLKSKILFVSLGQVSRNCNEDERVESWCATSNKLYLIFSPQFGRCAGARGHPRRSPRGELKSWFLFSLFFSLFKAYSCYQSDEVNEAEEIIFTTGGGNHLFLWIGRPTDQSGEQSRRQLVGISSARFFAQRWGFPQVVFKPPPATWAVVSRRQHLLQSTHISQSSALIGCFELVSFNSSAV